MADHSESTATVTAPDYDLDAEFHFTDPEQYRALFEPTRNQIVDLLLERAATISELAEALGKPKGTVGHHVGALEAAGLIRVVRTKKVRAVVAKYYGRTARTYVLGDKEEPSFALAKDVFLQEASAEYASAPSDAPVGPISTLRHARIPDDRAEEWGRRLQELVIEFTGQPRGGDTTYGLMVALYPTDRPHLPDAS